MVLFDVTKYWRGRGVRLETAIKILGHENVIGESEVRELFSLHQKPKYRVPYTRAQLRWCAEQNKQQKGRWKLIFRTGISALSVARLLPEYFPVTSAFDEVHDMRLDEPSEPGYRLLNFMLEPLPEKLPPGSYVVQAGVATVLESLVSLRILRKQRMLVPGHNHCSTCNGKALFVGQVEKQVMLFALDTHVAARTERSIGCLVPLIK